jgi:hypothetical protein
MLLDLVGTWAADDLELGALSDSVELGGVILGLHQAPQSPCA